MSNKLDQKITFIIDGTSEVGKEIVRSFLLENATVIVPAFNKCKLMQLEEYVKDIQTGKLISFLTNTYFEKRSIVSEILKKLFLRVDLILTVLENDAKDYSFFTDVEINDIQKTLKNDIWPCLICSQIFLTHGRRTRCMYIAVTQNSNQKSDKPLDRFLLNVQTQIAELVSEETDQVKKLITIIYF
ncbi:hypothetical protein [Pedobacter sp. NJ-S-72]